jgi:hypothetical protein
VTIDTMNKRQYLLVIALLLLALAGRLLPHPPNFTPLLAVALFGGAMLPRHRAFSLPLLAMAGSDLLLGYSFSETSVAVYASFLAIVVAGRWLSRSRTLGRTVAAVLGGSVLFYLVTNFAVWLGGAHGGMYEHSAMGLLECYVAALPFFRNALAGDLIWTAVLFGIFDFAARRLQPE